LGGGGAWKNIFQKHSGEKTEKGERKKEKIGGKITGKGEFAVER
jgi:hypothetical protein